MESLKHRLAAIFGLILCGNFLEVRSAGATSSGFNLGSMTKAGQQQGDGG